MHSAGLRVTLCGVWMSRRARATAPEPPAGLLPANAETTTTDVLASAEAPPAAIPGEHDDASLATAIGMGPFMFTPL